MPSDPACSAAQVWEQTLNQLLLRVTRQNYDTWLRNTVGARFDGTTLVVLAPTGLACDWLSTRMSTVVVQAISAVAGHGLQVRFEPADATPESNPQSGKAPLQPSLIPGPKTPLNPRFRFSTLLAAGFNQLALSAAHDLALGLENAYSPLFITGGSGNGKTHLLHAIAHEAASSDTSFLLVSAEQFLSEFTTAVRTKAGAAFRSRYRNIELLLIDDIHVLIGKKGTLNELFQTLAGLNDQGRRVVVTGDMSAMLGQAPRFHTQLHWGLVASIDQPATEDRIRFVSAKAAYQGVSLPDEVQHYLALRIRSSIRDLEGAVNRVTALARISNETISIDFVARALQPVSATPSAQQPQVMPSTLLSVVCNYLNIAPADITSARRDHALTYARHLAMYLLREDAGLTYSTIARLMGKKDHSTVVHAVTQLTKQLGLSPSLRADLDAIRASILNPNTAA